ncbi:MAG: 50S ribosomal protein L11 [Candidatus Zambryskibacteria bacterium CG10_big_fil_rev_8_21_14_0_10_42_12]|uniref:Large ribosomal subunit protein uL11 n=1 Tax=Candidatus Zambryskibacteria bacterium CG10_big_fil_rev_8_21_14_0_10_42_12 TaxID=1975115 RepID=A0A2H0QWZ0_9BACT|nr:MAG: 50S ribosomal protein L11 [Candidatus Zambryskibacteria bacterium CG10_big_fil_rev_8_21_14_0_10_42_12]
MAKKVIKVVKIQAMGGAATPAPPLGPALGGAGINIGEFVKQFNDRTAERRGEVVPAVINVYEDRTFDFILKTAPTSQMILKAIGQKSGSGKNTVKKVGTINKAQIKEIAEYKMADLNAGSIEAAMKIVEGTCRSMGVDVK